MKESKILKAVKESFSDFQEIERQEGARIERERISQLIYEKEDFLENESLKALIKEIEDGI